MYMRLKKLFFVLALFGIHGVTVASSRNTIVIANNENESVSQSIGEYSIIKFSGNSIILENKESKCPPVEYSLEDYRYIFFTNTETGIDDISVDSADSGMRFDFESNRISLNVSEPDGYKLVIFNEAGEVLYKVQYDQNGIASIPNLSNGVYIAVSVGKERIKSIKICK